MSSCDLVGGTFGRWSVISFSHRNKYGAAHWACMCSCGEERVVRGSHLKIGASVSCGCYKRELQTTRLTTHGLSDTVEYRTWEGVLQRCKNPKHHKYPSYGGRGIVVCESWLKFENFYADMGDRPYKGYSLDRIDNNGPYCKDNCRWATRKVQQNNRRANRLLTHNGETRTLSQWSEVTGIAYGTLMYRTLRGWSDEATITTPIRGRHSSV